MKIHLEARAGRTPPLAAEIEQPQVVIGSGAGCHFVVTGEGLDFTHVAPQHARIDLTPQGATLTDLGSDKGTWVGGKCVDQPLQLRAGMRFTLGRLGPTVTVKSLDLSLPAPAPEKRQPSSRRSWKPVAAALLLLLGLGAAAAILLQKLQPVDPGQFVGGDGDHFALVIAVGDYPDAQPLDDVAYADDDAVKLAHALHARGYDVTLMTQTDRSDPHLQALQPTAANIRHKLQQLLTNNRELDGADVVVVAFIGQSVKFPARGSRPATDGFFLCPADANVRGIEHVDQVAAENNLLSLNDIQTPLAQCRQAHVKLVYLDTCRFNPAAPPSTDALQAKSLPELAAPPGGVSLLVSCSPGEQTLIDTRLPGSAAVHYFTRALDGDAGAAQSGHQELTLDGLSRFLTDKTTQHVFSHIDGRRQRPELKGRESRDRVLCRLEPRAAAPGGSEPVQTASAPQPTPTPAPGPTPAELSPEDQVAHAARKFLQKYCAACHNGPSDDHDFEAILDHARLVAAAGAAEGYVVPKNLPASSVWVRAVQDKDMPPEDADQPTDEERQILVQWIDQGARPFPMVAATIIAGETRPAATDEERKLAEAARAFLELHCQRCHGGGQSKGSFANVLNPEALLQAGTKGVPYVTPGNPDESRVWQVVDKGTMPKGTGAELTAAQKQPLREWILAGAPAWGGEAVREPIPVRSVFEAMVADLRGLDAADRPYRRYFTLDHLYNNSFAQRMGGMNITDAQLRAMRAAVSKTVNSLTWNPHIRVPRTMGDPRTLHGTLLAIDLRDYGWTAADWQSLLDDYPYGLQWDAHRQDRELARLAEDVFRLAGTRLPMLRADWFVINATSPTHYFRLMRLPGNVDELERMLGVDSRRDFLQGRLMRSGFRQSGVSSNNRLLDRHETSYGPEGRGFYWRSYDFLKNSQRGNLELFPLGPDFRGNPFSEFAFDEDGGEIIFSLPNGLQAYYLIRKDGRQLDQGPIEVVKDETEISGSPAIVCALSCFYCHANGVITAFRDTTLASTQLTGTAFTKARDLYVPPEEMSAAAEADRDLFVRSLRLCIEPFLLVDGETRDVTEIPEPIGEIAKRYHGNQSDMALEDAASELYTTPEKLRVQIENVQKFRELGLGSLGSGGSIKRDLWEHKPSAAEPSIYQELARQIHGLDPVIPAGAGK